MEGLKGDQLMKTSEVQQVLQGNINWQNFCVTHEKEKTRLLSRKDGAATSGDLGLLFDSEQVVVTGKQIENLCKAVLKAEIDLYDAQFLATVIALSGFDFDRDDTEDAVLLISSPGSEDLGKIQDAMQMLHLG